ncbi:sulfotransferase family 2 domain-containing protein [Yunchengibacter salinarum]|uniref:sulfotransferase family 2 domain-containing protein n=1 Tax=Yunchengibacter salinarum TaxID=3133399 RepID=UPI0035B6882D
MISHEYNCIFIHIPRTGGSSIEHLVADKNWWSIDKKTKHLTASQAKRIYSEHWDDYFKFAFVRNPYDRAVSLLNFSKVYYNNSDSTSLTHFHIDGYKALFGAPLTVEYDYRFWSREEVLRLHHKPNQIYGNILDEEIDFIGRFENLQEDVNYIFDKIGFARKELSHLAASKIKKPKKDDFYADDATKNLVKELYYNDFKRFGYQMDWSKK